MQVARGGRNAAMKLDSTVDYQFVDVLTSADEDGSEEARTYVKTNETVNGRSSDSPLAGATAYFTKKAGHVNVKVSDGRRFLKRTLDEVLKEYDSVNIWLDLPSKAEVGATYKVDLTPVASVLIGNEGEVETAEAAVTLKSFDAASGIAVFQGKTGIREKKTDESDGTTGTIDYRLDGELHVAPGEGRISRMSFTGSMKGEMATGKTTGTLEGTYAVELKTAVGEAAAKALKEKPKVGAKSVSPRGIPVAISLPSIYDGEDAAPPKCEYQCIRTVDADKGTAGITLKPAGGDPKAPKATLDELERELKGAYPTLKTQNVSCALGAGRAYLFVVRSEKGNDLKIRAEVYPLGSTFLMYRLDASPSMFEVAEKEFIAARKTLRKSAESL